MALASCIISIIALTTSGATFVYLIVFVDGLRRELSELRAASGKSKASPEPDAT